MNQDQQNRLMERVAGNTPGGGGSGLLRMIPEAVHIENPNQEAAPGPKACAGALRRLAALAVAAAELLEDPDFIAEAWDVFYDGEPPYRTRISGG